MPPCQHWRRYVEKLYIYVPMVVLICEATSAQSDMESIQLRRERVLSMARLAIAPGLLLQVSQRKGYESMWTVFSRNHVEGPAVESFESACPANVDNSFVTHCAQLLSSVMVWSSPAATSYNSGDLAEVSVRSARMRVENMSLKLMIRNPSGRKCNARITDVCEFLGFTLRCDEAGRGSRPPLLIQWCWLVVFQSEVLRWNSNFNFKLIPKFQAWFYSAYDTKHDLVVASRLLYESDGLVPQTHIFFLS